MDLSRTLRGRNTARRLLIAFLSGVLVGVVLMLVGLPRYAPAVGWDAAALGYLVWTWLIVWPMSADDTCGAQQLRPAVLAGFGESRAIDL